jgi:carboxyl-terminal processing protease
MVWFGGLLFILDLAVLLYFLLWRTRPMPRWFFTLPIAALGIVAVHFVLLLRESQFLLIPALPGYLMTLLVLLAALPRLFRRRERALSVRFLFIKRALSAAGLIVLAFSAVRFMQFRGIIHATVKKPTLEREERATDLRAFSWLKSFEALKNKLAAEYPFTEWKRIDWDVLYKEFAPRVAAAEASHDRRAFYKAVREFLWRIPDGHVELEGEDGGLQQDEVGSSFGFELAELDDHRVVVSHTWLGGPAAQRGIAVGTELIAWNGLPVEQALATAPYFWSAEPPATFEGKRLEQLQFLPRGPAGRRASLTMRKRGSSSVEDVTLTAVPSEITERGFHPLKEFYLGGPVETRTLPSGCGYIRIRYELPTIVQPYPEDRIASALRRFQQSRARGVILDVRGNFGGSDAMVARMMAFFRSAESIYEYHGVYNPAARRFEIMESDAVRLVPAEPHYSGRVVVLIDARTLSSGEGVPLILKGLPNVSILGWHGTHGSFAINTKIVLLPANLSASFPQSQSIGPDRRIQIDSDYTGKGGVQPDWRPPLNENTLEAMSRENTDYLIDIAESVLLGGISMPNAVSDAPVLTEVPRP